MTKLSAEKKKMRTFTLLTYSFIRYKAVGLPNLAEFDLLNVRATLLGVRSSLLLAELVGRLCIDYVSPFPVPADNHSPDYSPMELFGRTVYYNRNVAIICTSLKETTS